jgi:hypothetical protein
MTISEILKDAKPRLCFKRKSWTTQYVVVVKAICTNELVLEFGDTEVESWGLDRWTPCVKEIQADDWERIPS